MIITVVIVALNAQEDLSNLLEDLSNQTFPHENLDVLLIDSLSTDKTKEIMQRFSKESGFAVRIFDNEKKWLASGCNIALREARGDAYIRLDAHARIPSDFLEQNAKAYATGKSIVGGAVLSAPPKSIKEAIVRTLDTSRFCGGAASFRNTGKARIVDALAYELCDLRVFEKTGPYDERLRRTEDNDMHYRMKLAGYSMYFEPSIVSYHKARSSLSGQLRQKWGNGVWIGRTLYIQPRCFAPRHLIPFFFVLLFLVLLALIPVVSPIPFLIFGLGYLLFDLLFSIQAMMESPIGKLPVLLLSPFLFPLVHFTYGFGTVWGILTPIRG